MNLSELTIQELNDLAAAIANEITSRNAQNNGFDRVWKLEGKAIYGCTKKQIAYAESLAKKTGSSIAATTSQMMLRLESDEMSEAIDLMKEGKRIRIY
jgi:hypothetical protein